MILAFVTAVALVPPRAQPAELRHSFLAGDLVAFERGRAVRAERGSEVWIGEVALLEDLSRLARCLPLGPIPRIEDPEHRALRQLVRVERIRLESLARDGLFEETALAELLEQPPLYAAKVLDRGRDEVVRWPVERERWPGEIIDPIPEPARCALKPGAMKELDAGVHREHARVRARALREAIAALLPSLEMLPGDAAARVALAYLEDASAAPGFHVPAEWRARLGAALARGAAPYRTAGLLELARVHELEGELASAEAIARAVIADPTATEAEDSRARARLVGLVEPAWESVLELARGARAMRTEDAPVLANAEARALYALGRWSALETFGRVWLRGPHGDGPFETMTRELLLRVGLELEPSAAMAWALELGGDASNGGGGGGGGEPWARLDRLGKLALESGALPLATAVYDRLRVEAAGARGKLGPSAAVDEARWIAQRALIEFAADDAEAFGGFVDALVALAKAESERPLARFAPHREVARLCQELLGRLTNEVREKPERRRFAALLLEAARALAEKPSRWQEALRDFDPPLATLAGPYAGAKPSPASATAAAKRRGAKARKVRLLGEVAIARLPPRLEAPDTKTQLPIITSFLVYPNEDGALVVGAPWRALAEKRKADAEAAAQAQEEEP